MWSIGKDTKLKDTALKILFYVLSGEILYLAVMKYIYADHFRAISFFNFAIPIFLYFQARRASLSALKFKSFSLRYDIIFLFFLFSVELSFIVLMVFYTLRLP